MRLVTNLSHCERCYSANASAAWCSVFISYHILLVATLVPLDINYGTALVSASAGCGSANRTSQPYLTSRSAYFAEQKNTSLRPSYSYAFAFSIVIACNSHCGSCGVPRNVAWPICIVRALKSTVAPTADKNDMPSTNGSCMSTTTNVILRVIVSAMHACTLHTVLPCSVLPFGSRTAYSCTEITGNCNAYTNRAGAKL